MANILPQKEKALDSKKLESKTSSSAARHAFVSYFVFYNLNIFILSMGKFGVRRLNHPITIQEFFCRNWVI